MNLKILLLSGFIIYTANYITGWLLLSGKISMKKKTHQIIFILLIINLILILAIEKTFTGKIICSFSLICMIILPLGKKGGTYHILLSSLGYIIFVYLFILNLF